MNRLLDKPDFYRKYLFGSMFYLSWGGESNELAGIVDSYKTVTFLIDFHL
jgi:hypothetical protein